MRAMLPIRFLLVNSRSDVVGIDTHQKGGSRNPGLGITLVVYASIALSALFAVGPDILAGATAPLAVAAEGGISWASPLVRAGGAVASLGVLLSLLAGVSRTVFAMARNGELPTWFAAVHPRHRTPYRAEIAVGIAVAAITSLADLRGAIGFSSFAVLTYYAIANASAFTQSGTDRRWPRSLQVVGLAGCVLLALSLPASSVIGGGAALSVGAVLWFRRNRAGAG